MFSTNQLSKLVNKKSLEDDLFINASKGELVIEPLMVVKPQDLKEWKDICQYSKNMNIKFKIIKGHKSQFVNPGNYSDFFVVDVDNLDTIVGLEGDVAMCLPGTTASQLNNYLDKANPIYKLPLSLELTDPLLIYNRPCLAQKFVEYHLVEHQLDNRWLIIGFESLDESVHLTVSPR